MPGTFSHDLTLVEDAEVLADYTIVGALKTARALNDDSKIEGTNCMTWGVSSATAPGVGGEMATAPFTAVFSTANDSVFNNNTAEAYAPAGTAFTLFPTPGTSDRTYVGLTVLKFAAMYLDIATARTGGTGVVFEYWNGAWTALSVTDGTSAFSVDGTVSWTIPTDWVVTTVNGLSAFWVRMRLNSAPTVNPTVSWLVPSLFNNSGNHFFQWIKCVSWPSLETQRAGGTRIVFSNSAGASFTQVRATLSATIAAAGSGYALNDVLSLSGGTQTEVATFKVTALSGSGVAAVTPTATARGSYTVLPSNPVSTTVSPAGGTGCTLTVTWVYTIASGKEWFIGGSDTTIVDGWVNYAVDIDGTPDVQTNTSLLSTSAGTRLGVVGSMTVGTSKLATHYMDVSRVGTGITVVDGTSGSPVTLSDFTTYDNANARALGIIIPQNGIYFLAGKLYIGKTGQTAVTVFKETGQVLVYQGFPVKTTFYEIVLAGAGGFATTFQLGTYSGGIASGGVTIRGANRYTHYAGVVTTPVPAVWTLTANAANTVCLLYGSTFSELLSAVFRSDSEIRFCTFQNCGTLTTGGALFDNCAFLDLKTTAPISATWALIVTSPTEMAAITNSKFINCNRAIKITTAGTYAFDTLDFIGNTYDVENASAGAVIINVTGTAGNPVTTYINTGGGSVTINNQIAVTLTGMKDNTEVRVYTAGTTTELDGIENATDGTADNRSFTFTLNAATVVDIRIHNVTYEPQAILGYTVPAADTAIPVQQRFDRTFSNP